MFRGLVGVGLGGVPVAFAMLAEVTPAQYRGTFLIMMEIFWSLGAVFQAGIAWVVLPQWGWRGLLIVSALPLGESALKLALAPCSTMSKSASNLTSFFA